MDMDTGEKFGFVVVSHETAGLLLVCSTTFDLKMEWVLAAFAMTSQRGRKNLCPFNCVAVLVPTNLKLRREKMCHVLTGVQRLRCIGIRHKGKAGKATERSVSQRVQICASMMKFVQVDDGPALR